MKKILQIDNYMFPHIGGIEQVTRDVLNALKDEKNTLCFVIGFEKIWSKISEETKNKFTEMLAKIKELRKLSFVFTDIPSNFKKYEYDAWFKDCFNTDNGIWVGQGVTQQYLLKIQTNLSIFTNITSEYGVILKNQVPLLLKLINEYNEK